MKIEIKTASKDIFNCLACKKVCEKLRSINVGDYVYICGSAFCYYDNYCKVGIEEIYTL